MRFVKPLWHTVKQAISDFIKDDAIMLAGTLAFYTALSFPPLILILLSLASLLGPSVQEQFLNQVETLIGPQAGQALAMVVESAAERPGLGSFAGIVGLMVLFFPPAAYSPSCRSRLTASGMYARNPMPEYGGGSGSASCRRG
jgi:uncharacterized BrkB/YihY/UPF0761 family membrane protein